MPLGDFAGYVAQMQSVRDALLRHGRVPLWCSGCYGGTTNFTGDLKELVAFPLVLWLGPLLATKLCFALLKLLAALGLYALVVRLFRAPAVGLVAGYAYGFGAIANHEREHLDVAVSMVLLPPIVLACVELLRRPRLAWAVALGALGACQLINNWVHAISAAVALPFLLAIRPWRERPGEADPLRDLRLARRWGCHGAVALGALLVLAGSHLALLTSDAPNHRLSPPATIAREQRIYVEPSPFLYLNRDGALDAWLARHHPPELSAFVADGGSRYVGGVVLAVCLAGALALRRGSQLVRWARVAWLVLLVQYWLALGPRTLLWEVGESLRWAPADLQTLSVVLRLSAVLALAAGAVLAARARAREATGGRAGAWRWVAVALVLAFPTFSLWDLLRRALPPLDVQRSPFHYFDTAPFWIYLLFAIALVALSRRIARRRLATGLWAAVALAVVVDYAPSRRVYSEGLEMDPLRRDAELVEGLDGEGATLRLVVSPVYSPLASWVAAQAPTGHAWGWLPWQSGRHWAEFIRAAAFRTEASGRGGAPRLAPDAALLAIGRIRYFLSEVGTGPRSLPAPWRLLRAGARFSVWEQSDVAPFASVHDAYLLLDGDAPGAASVVAAAARENALVVSAASGAAEDAELRRRARAILRSDEAALLDDARGWRERLRDPPVPPPRALAHRREGPEGIALEVEAGAGPRMVFVGEGYHPWWRARVDGEPAPVLRAQMAFLAVPVGAGRHTIELRLERPPGVAAARWLSALGWIGLALVASGAALRRIARAIRTPAARRV